MTSIGGRARRNASLARVPAAAVLAAVALAAGPARAQSAADAIYEGKSVRIGHGTAHTITRTDANGNLTAIGVAFTRGALDGLPAATKTTTDFPYLLPMPVKGPKTVVDHVVINWEAAGHPPPHVYDVPHFDFHFYLVSRADQMNVAFDNESQSSDPSQQPAAALLPAGYVVPPGTALSKMGVHAVNPAAAEFHGQPFTATFIYGYYNKRQTFLEPMVSLAYLKSQPSFAAPVVRPASYGKRGAYPTSYSVNYDAAHKLYRVMLEGLQP
jgi:hypothetical protein